MSQLLQPEDTGPAPEPASFEATFRAHCAGLCEFVYAYVRSREIAQEMVQDLFLRLWELQGAPTASLSKSYLYTAIPPPGTGPSVTSGIIGLRLDGKRGQRGSERPFDQRLASEFQNSSVSGLIDRPARSRDLTWSARISPGHQRGRAAPVVRACLTASGD